MTQHRDIFANVIVPGASIVRPRGAYLIVAIFAAESRGLSNNAGVDKDTQGFREMQLIRGDVIRDYEDKAFSLRARYRDLRKRVQRVARYSPVCEIKGLKFRFAVSALRKTGGNGARDECVCEMHRDQGSRSDFIFILSTSPLPSPLAPRARLREKNRYSHKVIFFSLLLTADYNLKSVDPDEFD